MRDVPSAGSEFVVLVDDTEVPGDWRSAYIARMRGRDFDATGYVTELVRNSLSDPARLDGPDWYLFCAWRIEWTPVAPATRPEQVELARHLLCLIRGLGCRAVVAAEWEGDVEAG